VSWLQSVCLEAFLRGTVGTGMVACIRSFGVPGKGSEVILDFEIYLTG
jgi:hypothetical protein